MKVKLDVARIIQNIKVEFLFHKSKFWKLAWQKKMKVEQIFLLECLFHVSPLLLIYLFSDKSISAFILILEVTFQSAYVPQVNKKNLMEMTFQEVWIWKGSFISSSPDGRYGKILSIQNGKILSLRKWYQDPLCKPLFFFFWLIYSNENFTKMCGVHTLNIRLFIHLFIC